MKTKTLLIAAAALAVTTFTSQAAVYSQNVVGYASIATPSAGFQYLVSVPFKIGVSNGANEVFPGTTLPYYSQLSIWDPIGLSYSIAQTDPDSPTGWSDGSYTPINIPVLPVGMGFFLSPSQDNLTNTFAGAVAVNVGSSNVMTLPSAGFQYLVGCVVPYSGSITNSNGLNLNGLPLYTQISLWDPIALGYAIAQNDPDSPSGWSDGSYTPIGVPTLSVGQGFFISPAQDNTTWTNTLSF